MTNKELVIIDGGAPTEEDKAWLKGMEQYLQAMQEETETSELSAVMNVLDEEIGRYEYDTRHLW